LKSTSCLNCGRALAAGDNYCPRCGQTNHDLRIPFRHLFMEVFEGLLHFDSKSYQTVKALLFRPGFLTNEFKIGRRASYVPPIRLYIFVSFLFFFLLSLGKGGHQAGQPRNTTVAGQPVTLDSDELKISFAGLGSSDLAGKSPEQIDSVMDAHKIEKTFFKRYLAIQLGRVAAGGKAEFDHLLLKGFSYMMFVLMPILALFIYMFHRKRVEYYLDCLVFSVHYHSFAFLLFTVYLLVNRVVGSGYLILLLPIIVMMYFWLALRVVYPQVWWKGWLKTAAIGLLHVAAIFTCFMLLVMANVLLF
jgi:hypothetical protein